MPTPSVIITSSNASDHEDIGVAVTLTCSVTFDPSLASFVNTSVTWLREDILILNSTESVLISSSPLDSQFTSNLTLYPTNDTFTANFTCRAGIIPTDELTSLIASDFQEETIPVTIQGELQLDRSSSR